MRYVIVVDSIILAAAIIFVPTFFFHEPDFRSLTPQNEITFAERFVQDIRAHRFDAASAMVDRSYRPHDVAIFEKMRAAIPQSRWQRTRVAGWVKSFGRDGTITRLTLFCEFDSGDALRAIFTLIDDKHALKAAGVNFTYLTANALHANDFKLSQVWAGGRWFVVTIAIFIDATVFATFGLCILGPAPRWRWRWFWLVATLFGAIRFSMNWTTAELYLAPLAIRAPPAVLELSQVYAPWVLVMHVPVGTLAYWIWRRYKSSTKSSPTLTPHLSCADRS